MIRHSKDTMLWCFTLPGPSRAVSLTTYMYSCTSEDEACCDMLRCMQAVLTWVAQQAAVSWVSPRSRITTRNLVGNAICQGGNLTGLDAATSLAGSVAGSHPLWEAGLQVGIVPTTWFSGVHRPRKFEGGTDHLRFRVLLPPT